MFSNLSDEEFLDFLFKRTSINEFRVVPLELVRLFQLSGDKDREEFYKKLPEKFLHPSRYFIKRFIKKARENLKK